VRLRPLRVGVPGPRRWRWAVSAANHALNCARHHRSIGGWQYPCTCGADLLAVAESMPVTGAEHQPLAAYPRDVELADLCRGISDRDATIARLTRELQEAEAVVADVRMLLQRLDTFAAMAMPREVRNEYEALPELRRVYEALPRFDAGKGGG
jgi:hypothetical protein